MEKLGSSSLGHLLTLHLGKSTKGRKFQVLPREQIYTCENSLPHLLVKYFPAFPPHTHTLYAKFKIL